MEQMEQSFAPQYEQKEAYSPDFFAERAAEESLEKIKGNFENPESARENLAFHNSVHTERIIERTGLIIDAIKEANPELVSEKTKVLGTISAAFHDTVQGWEEKNAKDGDFAKTTIGRFVGQNEKASADLGAEFMDKSNKESNMEIFSEDDKKILREAIEATVPGFDPKKGVIQPNLNENSSIVARALALADLGGAGMAGPEIFLEEGDVLFKEENLDIREARRGNSVRAILRIHRQLGNGLPAGGFFDIFLVYLGYVYYYL